MPPTTQIHHKQYAPYSNNIEVEHFQDHHGSPSEKKKKKKPLQDQNAFRSS